MKDISGELIKDPKDSIITINGENQVQKDKILKNWKRPKIYILQNEIYLIHIQNKRVRAFIKELQKENIGYFKNRNQIKVLTDNIEIVLHIDKVEGSIVICDMISISFN